MKMVQTTAFSKKRNNVSVPTELPKMRRVNLCAGISIENGLEGYTISLDPINSISFTETITTFNT